jgi:hypothetical protein
VTAFPVWRLLVRGAGRIRCDVNEPGATQIERVQRLLAHEATQEGAGAPARVYDKLVAQLAPLVGAAGVQALFMRSAKLAQGEFADLAQASILEGAAALRERLASPGGVAEQSALTLFATFLALVTEFIGERLTHQILRRAWPMLDDQVPETEK